jgi:hypothetical protein
VDIVGKAVHTRKRFVIKMGAVLTRKAKRI